MLQLRDTKSVVLTSQSLDFQIKRSRVEFTRDIFRRYGTDTFHECCNVNFNFLSTRLLPPKLVDSLESHRFNLLKCLLNRIRDFFLWLLYLLGFLLLNNFIEVGLFKFQFINPGLKQELYIFTLDVIGQDTLKFLDVALELVELFLIKIILNFVHIFIKFN